MILRSDDPRPWTSTLGSHTTNGFHGSPPDDSDFALPLVPNLAPPFPMMQVIAEQERQARRRMLGNMQFIGQLYKYALLTERIMHNCVQQLLQVRVRDGVEEEIGCVRMV